VRPAISAAAHRYNFPLTEILCRDVRCVKGRDLIEAAKHGWRHHHREGEPWDGVVDALIGGPSCQGFSEIGRHDLNDERNGLLLEFVRLVIEIRPRMFCLENVPGLLHAAHKSLRDNALTKLQKAGYNVTGMEVALNAADFGVPQNRRRLLIMGSAETKIEVPQPFPDSHVTVAEAFEGLPDPTDYAELIETDSVLLSEADIAARAATVAQYARVLAGLSRDPSDRSWPRLWNSLLLTNSRTSVHTAASVARFSATPQGSAEPVSKFYRLSLDGQSRTLRAGTGRERGAFTSPRPIHPIQPRVITIREAARLHSFPDWFRFNVTNWHGHRQIGNSVPPLLARAVAEQLIAAIGVFPQRPISTINLGDETLLRLHPGEAMLAMSAHPDQVPPRRLRQRRATKAPSP
jgi:DNA (cytosine-5)-methyltransferase 1